MAKYLVQASYSQEGLKGLLKDGGSRRRAALQEAVASLGGRLEAFYYTFGKSDVIAIFELPDNVSASALAMTVSSSGAVSSYETTVLIEPEEVDQAVQKAVAYRRPGQ